MILYLRKPEPVMRYLIDGHNLIPNLPDLSLQQLDDEQQLIERLLTFCQSGPHQVEVFFDNAPAGQNATRRFGRVTAHFVRAGQTADAAISRRLIGLGRNARQWCVVSSDRMVQAAGRAAQAAVMPSPEFASRLRQSRAAPAREESAAPLSQEEVELWLRIFGTEHPRTPPKSRQP